jgi:hypothetical protein
MLRVTLRELKVRRYLTKLLKEKIEQRWGAEELHQRLGLVLLKREDWCLETAFRVAESIGTDLEINVRTDWI